MKAIVNDTGPRISQVLDGLESSVDDLTRFAGSAKPDGVRRAAEVTLSWIRALNVEVPTELKKGPFRRLQQHMRFVELCLDRGDQKMVRSNIRSLRPEMIKLRSLCAANLLNPTADLGISLDELGPSQYKTMLVEACKCYKAEAFPAAVVASVCSLEGLYRSIYRQKTGKDPTRLEFKRIIDELHDGGHLKGLEEPLLQIARIYRNFLAHPSGLSAERDETKALIQFAFAKLKSGTRR